MFWVKRSFYKLQKIGEMFWSGRPDLNRGPPAPKAGVLPLGSPSFSILPVKAKDLVKKFAGGTLYEKVPPHAWSPPNFPHTEKEAKARKALQNGAQNRQRVGSATVIRCFLSFAPSLRWCVLRRHCLQPKTADASCCPSLLNGRERQRAPYPATALGSYFSPCLWY